MRIIAIVLIALTSGCITVRGHAQSLRTADAVDDRAAVAPDRVQLVLGIEPPAPYEIRGVVAADVHKGEDYFAALKAEAGRLGADAVMRVRMERGNGYVQVRGVAISYATVK